MQGSAMVKYCSNANAITDLVSAGMFYEVTVASNVSRDHSFSNSGALLNQHNIITGSIDLFTCCRNKLSSVESRNDASFHYHFCSQAHPLTRQRILVLLLIGDSLYWTSVTI
jgi:hypothetical protein